MGFFEGVFCVFSFRASAATRRWNCCMLVTLSTVLGECVDLLIYV